MQKVKPFRCKKYLKRVAELGCAICHSPDAVAHHVTGSKQSGMGTKPSDKLTFPLCVAHHHFIHQYGYKTFEHKFGHQADFIRQTQEALNEKL